MADALNQFTLPGTLLNGVTGPDLASAATIAPTHAIHRVTGTAAIVNITVPYTGFAGTIVLIPTAIWTWTAAGNIIVAGTTTAGNGVPVSFTYNPTTAKWSPSRIA